MAPGLLATRQNETFNSHSSGYTLVAAMPGTPSRAAEIIRVAVQKTGTFAWDLAVIRAHGLDKREDLAIQVNELANPEAGKIALRGGAADIRARSLIGSAGGAC
jgi:hypothetical protein